MKLGIDRLLESPRLQSRLRGRRVALLAHPASVTSRMVHTLDALADLPGVRLTAALGPQHGILGDKQDNMVETEDSLDPQRGIPLFSLYGAVRRPTARICETFDVLLVDLQDLGTRVYTYLTTVLYVLGAGAEQGKQIWILDRPNPAGRPVEGTRLLPGNESFVGASTLPMRHGLTLGEAARWFVAAHAIDVDLQVVQMSDYDPHRPPGLGWCPELPWINPSPNAGSLNMARCYPGTVLLEGTTLSEGRGTTVPLEVAGAPDLRRDAILADMRALGPGWLDGVLLRPCAFEPTFHKHSGALCHGFQLHTDWPAGYRHAAFRPYRLLSLFLKALRRVHPDYSLWHDHAYEYTEGRLAIDVIDGGPLLRRWVDDPAADIEEREARLTGDEASWIEQRRSVLLYP